MLHTLLTRPPVCALAEINLPGIASTAKGLLCFTRKESGASVRECVFSSVHGNLILSGHLSNNTMLPHYPATITCADQMMMNCWL